MDTIVFMLIAKGISSILLLSSPSSFHLLPLKFLQSVVTRSAWLTRSSVPNFNK